MFTNRTFIVLAHQHIKINSIPAYVVIKGAKIKKRKAGNTQRATVTVNEETSNVIHWFLNVNFPFTRVCFCKYTKVSFFLMSFHTQKTIESKKSLQLNLLQRRSSEHWAFPREEKKEKVFFCYNFVQFFCTLCVLLRKEKHVISFRFLATQLAGFIRHMWTFRAALYFVFSHRPCDNISRKLHVMFTIAAKCSFF